MTDNGPDNEHTRNLRPEDDPEATRILDTSRKETGPSAPHASSPTPPPGPPPTAGGVTAGFRPGLVILSRYTLGKILGRGGFGSVWLAHDEELRMDVAIKFLSELIISNPDAVEDLKRETRYSLRLTHPNIVRTYGFLQSEDIVGIAMEYVPGGTLVHLRAGRERRCFGPGELAPWLGQLCDALDYAHQKVQIVHRDLKPANLMIDDHQDLKVADFGISRSVSDSRTRMTNDRDTSGTLAYMSPQQMMGDPARVTDDIYSLGATLYDLLTGKPPFYSGDIVQQVMRVTPPSVEQRRIDLDETGEAVPPDWEETLAACLAKEADKRPASAGEVAERLGVRTSSAGRSMASMSMPSAIDPEATRVLSTSRDAARSEASAPAGAGAGAAKPEPARPEPLPPPRPAVEERKKTSPALWIGIAAAVVIAVGAWFTFRPKDAAVRPPADTAANTTPVTTSPPPEPEEAAPATNDVATDPNASRITELRNAISAAFADDDLDAAQKAVDDLLAIAPGDPAALGQRQVIADRRAKVERIARLRRDVPAALAAKDLARAETLINEWLNLAPDDARASRAREDLIAARAAAAARPAETARTEPPVKTESKPEPPKPAPVETKKTEVPPPDPTAADRAAIQQVLAGYERALENLDADGFAALWESMSGGEKKRLADSFKDLDGMAVDLRIGSIDVNGSSAVVQLHEERTLEFKAGKDQAVARDLTVRMTKSGGAWKIAKLEVK